MRTLALTLALTTATVAWAGKGHHHHSSHDKKDKKEKKAKPGAGEKYAKAAKKLYDKGKFADAARAWQKAHDKASGEEAAGYLYSAAQAYRRAGKLAEAQSFYQQYLREANEAPPELRATVEKQAQEVAAALEALQKAQRAGSNEAELPKVAGADKPKEPPPAPAPDKEPPKVAATDKPKEPPKVAATDKPKEPPKPAAADKPKEPPPAPDNDPPMALMTDKPKPAPDKEPAPPVATVTPKPAPAVKAPSTEKLLAMTPPEEDLKLAPPPQAKAGGNGKWIALATVLVALVGAGVATALVLLLPKDAPVPPTTWGHLMPSF